MPYIAGYLIEGGVNNDLPNAPGRPDNSLPIVPGRIDNSLPIPPPGVFPPLTPTHPIAPAPPGTPPGTIWPPLWSPVDPGYGQGVPRPPHVDGGLPAQPGHPDQGLPIGPGHPDQGLPAKTYWVIVGIPGLGWRYAAIDPSLKPGHELPPAPPTAQPKEE